MSRPFVLYGAERSYFTGKVRPALRAKRLYFEEVLVTNPVYADIKRRTGLLAAKGQFAKARIAKRADERGAIGCFQGVDHLL